MTVGTHDPGLQPQRTELSWERTGLGMMATAAIVMLRPDTEPGLPTVVFGISVLTAATLVAVLGHRRSHAVDIRARGLAVSTTAVFVACLSVIGLLTVWV